MKGLKYMTKNSSNTEPTESLLNPNIPLIVKLITKEELIVSGVSEKPSNTKHLILHNPYGIYKQNGNIRHLFLSKWMPYTIGDMFAIDKKNILTIAFPSDDLLYHYSECLQEEIGTVLENDERITTSQTSDSVH